MSQNIHSVSCEVGGKTLTIETGKLARQADGSALVSYGDTRVLVTVCGASEPRPDQSFFPLTVEFSEKHYASGRIPGSFHRREGRPTGDATLSARMIDRPIRPLFPEGYLCDTQVVATILSLDTEADVDMCAAAGTSAALTISDIPFNGPTAACRVGRKDGQYVIAPTWETIENRETDIEILVAGTANAVTMVEGAAEEVSEDDVLGAVLAGHEVIKSITAAISDLQKKCGKPKREFTSPTIPSDIEDSVKKLAQEGLAQSLKTRDKMERYSLAGDTKKKVLEELVPESLRTDDPATAKQREKDAKTAFENLQYDMMRQMVLKEKVRIDGRDSTTIRPINTEAGLLPRTHGSALFTRGETQVLGAVTLGTKDDEQLIDTIYKRDFKKYMLHYNFPPFSVGETGRMGGQSRREIGHGALAERSVLAVLPSYEDFPYTLRVVCETLESNGSSSMGSVCASSMALMDAGVPIRKPVAGIAMGLIKEDSDVAILSDILGDEDHLGDMDFKIAGTKDGVTGIQMDIKIEGVTEEIMRTALSQAREGRLHILGKMADSITEARTEMSKYAPRITAIQIPQDKIGTVVGPGGKMIKEIVAQTGCKVDINDDGTVKIASNDPEKAKEAIDWIKGLTAEVELNKVYKGTVKKIVDFGAFIGLIPNQDGLLHVSEIAYERVDNVTDFFKEGDEVEVKVIDIDANGKVRLSRKVLLEMPEGYEPPPPREIGADAVAAGVISVAAEAAAEEEIGIAVDAVAAAAVADPSGAAAAETGIEPTKISGIYVSEVLVTGACLHGISPDISQSR